MTTNQSDATSPDLPFLRPSHGLACFGMLAVCVGLLVVCFATDVFQTRFVPIVAAISGAGIGFALAEWRRVRRVDWAKKLGLAETSRWFVCDRTGRLIHASQGLVDMFAEWHGRSSALDVISELASDENSRASVDRLRSAIEDGVPEKVELLITAAGGQAQTWYDAELRPDYDDGNQFVCLLNQHDAQVFESATEAENLSWQAAVDLVPLPMLVTDADGRLISANRELCALTARTSEELAGDLVLPREFLQGGGEFDLPVAGDRLQPCRVYTSATVSPEMLGDRYLLVLVPADLDKELQHQLRAAQERFDQLFNYAPVAVLILGKDGEIVEANPVFHQYFASDDNPAIQSIYNMFRSDEQAQIRQKLEATLVGQQTEDAIEATISIESGDRFVQLFANRLVDADGEASGLLLQLVDTTEQRNLEQQFAQSQKMQAIGQLAGGVAHDFNNLLTAMIGHCDLLLLRARPGDEFFPDVMQIKQNANRAANLVRQLLAFSRQQTLHPKVLSLTDVLAELTHLVRRLIGENIAFDMSHGRELWPVLVDQGQLEQVIINLAVNARDAMENGGELAIRTSNISRADSAKVKNRLMPIGNYVMIEVADTGKGIAPADLGRIFEPFFTTKMHSASGLSNSGTGLGLSTVFGIIKQTGGYIFPESTVGVGTTFRIYLPRHEETETARAVREDVAEHPLPSSQDLTGIGKVLLVEDETAVRVFAARALRSKGYTVIEAESGEAALAELANLPDGVDLIVTDVVMPQMDGPTLVRHIRKTHPDVKVVFISGYAEDAFRKNLDPYADFDLLPKPFSLNQLASKVKAVIGDADITA